MILEKDDGFMLRRLIRVNVGVWIRFLSVESDLRTKHDICHLRVRHDIFHLGLEYNSTYVWRLI